MSYKYNYIQSPNYTPASQAKAIYGRIRTIDFGAGHWWGDPNAGYQHQGIINTFLNVSRQASAHFVISAGWVTGMVNPKDIAWATNNANAFTVALEVDPRIIFKWNGGTAEQVRLANEIFETTAELVADQGWHNLQWLPHKHWKPSTQCNPIRWGEVMDRAKQIRNAKDNPPPAPNPIPEWKRNLKPITPITLYAIDDTTPLRNLANTPEVIKNFPKDTSFQITAETTVSGYKYYLTKYAFENNTGQGFDEYELKPESIPVPVVPEWQKNFVRIDPVKLMVLVPETGIYDLNLNGPIKKLAKGTWVDFLARTTVNGEEYLISSYSVENAIPNGIKATDVGIPAIVPPEKPEWLANWKDIEDALMYTRLDAPLVNLIDGSTIKTIPVNTEVQIASATVWHGQNYLITKYSTDTGQAAGISLTDLDMNPVEFPEDDEPKAPEQPDIRDQINLIIRILQAIAKFLRINI